MTKLTADEVKKLAALSKIVLTDDEVDRYQKELEAILGYVAALEEIDTAGVEPTSQVTGLTNSFREDKIEDYGVTKDELLKNAPESIADYIQVKRVIE